MRKFGLLVILLSSGLSTHVLAGDYVNKKTEEHTAFKNRLSAIDAVKKNRLYELRTLIETQKVSVDTKDSDSRTLLMWASCRGNEEIVKYLIDRGAKLNIASTRKGMTALLYAADQGHYGVAVSLIKAGAKLEPRSRSHNENDTALERAIYNGHSEIAHLLIDKIMESDDPKSLIQGAESIVNDYQGDHLKQKINSYCAHQACKKGLLSELKHFIENLNVSVNTSDGKNRTLLMWAAYRGHEDIVDYLIGKKADLDAVTFIKADANVNPDGFKKDMTALLYAADQGHLAIVQALVLAGADTSLEESTFGDTAQSRAKHNKHDHVFNWLKKHGHGRGDDTAAVIDCNEYQEGVFDL